jgi:hypothetical protein
MAAISNEVPVAAFRSFPILLTRHLCGRESSRDLGLDEQVSWGERALFTLAMLLARVADAAGKVFVPDFSLARLATRVLGYQLVTRFLMDETAPLKVPRHVMGDVEGMVGTWSHDPRAGRWVNALENRMTTPGAWERQPRLATLAENGVYQRRETK